MRVVGMVVIALGAVLRSSRLLVDRDRSGQRWRYDRQHSEPDEGAQAITGSAALLAAYLVALAFGLGAAVTVDRRDVAARVVFKALSALDPVGPSLGLAQSDLPWHGKVVLIVLMWLGRLEVVAVAVLVGAPLLAGLRRDNGTA